MAFTFIKTYNFRNLKNDCISLEGKEIFLVGNNGQGKSNFLEAIYYLCFASSFRTKKDNEIIHYDKDEMSLIGILTNDIKKVKGNLDHENEKTQVYLTEKGKKIYVDEKKINDRKELLTKNPCIVFTHNDIDFVKGSPEEKRNFFNQTMSLYDPDFVDLIRIYKKILSSRNLALKNNNRNLIDAYTIQYAKAGLDIQKRRVKTVEKFNTIVSNLFTKITGISDTLAVVYRPSWGNNETVDSVVNLLDKVCEKDCILGTTTTGPHRDRFYYYLADKEYTRIASTGQLRLLSLVLRVAQSNFCVTKSGKKAILLLDDVLLELDPTKRKHFLENLPDYEQAFFTFLPDEQYIGMCKYSTILYKVENGCLRST